MTTAYKIARFTSSSQCSYADALVTFGTAEQRDQLIADFVRECSEQERAACYVEEDGTDPAIYDHTPDTPVEITPDDLDEKTGLARDGEHQLTYRDIMNAGPGVTLLSSGPNG